jgi:hypothetical protein
VIARIGVWNQSVESIVAAGELYDYKLAIGIRGLGTRFAQPDSWHNQAYGYQPRAAFDELSPGGRHSSP